MVIKVPADTQDLVIFGNKEVYPVQTLSKLTMRCKM